MESWTIVGLLAGLMTTAGFIPQLVKGLRTKRMDDVSFLMPLILIAGMTMWLLYGVLIGDLPIVFWNAIGIGINSGILFLKRIYSAHYLEELAESPSPDIDP
jgi:MtN3 and saliva related transmembrane protein